MQFKIAGRRGHVVMQLLQLAHGKGRPEVLGPNTLEAIARLFRAGLLPAEEASVLTDGYVFYVDGKEVWRSAAGGVSQVAEYIKLTEEIGTWAGDIQKAELPDVFEVDYVRVYDAVSASE